MESSSFGVSVLISVYAMESSSNLKKCLRSIAEQTFVPEEIILVEDGPLTEELYNEMDSWQETLGERLARVPLKENQGLAAALNEGLIHCRCHWVARMDTDDVMLPERLERQIGFLKQNPHIDVVGSWIAEFDETLSVLLGVRHVPGEHQDIYNLAKTRNPMNHMSVIFRKTAVLQAGGYSLAMRKNQDYVLWVTMLSMGFIFANIPEILVKVRAGIELMGRRRGLGYFRYERYVFAYMKKIGFINTFEFLKAVTLRFTVRMMPKRIVQCIYGLLRQPGKSSSRKKVCHHG